MRDKVTFTYKPGRGDHGHIYNNIDKISDDHLKVIQNAVNGEIVRRRELVDHPELKPEKNSFFKKLRRFIRRLNAEIITEWLDYGQLRGFGQWRNSGKGRFTWELIED